MDITRTIAYLIGAMIRIALRTFIVSRLVRVLLVRLKVSAFATAWLTCLVLALFEGLFWFALQSDKYAAVGTLLAEAPAIALWLIVDLRKARLTSCPYCEETVRAQAKICRHCGQQIQAGQGL